jgi:hypothetical protein
MCEQIFRPGLAAGIFVLCVVGANAKVRIGVALPRTAVFDAL